jgi:hypothetical protein
MGSGGIDGMNESSESRSETPMPITHHHVATARQPEGTDRSARGFSRSCEPSPSTTDALCLPLLRGRR